ncbi:MAG: hypothetical protein ABFD84_04395 [Candidatus Polarisedimenticolia bacterium]
MFAAAVRDDGDGTLRVPSGGPPSAEKNPTADTAIAANERSAAAFLIGPPAIDPHDLNGRE